MPSLADYLALRFERANRMTRAVEDASDVTDLGAGALKNRPTNIRLAAKVAGPIQPCPCWWKVLCVTALCPNRQTSLRRMNSYRCFEPTRSSTLLEPMDYHLKPLGKTCAATGKPLVPGSICHSVLVEKDGGLVRLDFSQEGWTAAPAGHHGHWMVEVPAAPNPQTQRIDPEIALRYFEQLSEEASPVHEKTRYTLALVLLQQRKLKLENVRFEDDDEFLELSGVHGEGNFEVRNYHLDDSETQRMQSELKSQLAAEWQS